MADLPTVRFDVQAGAVYPSTALHPPSFILRRINEGFPERKDLARPLPLDEVPVREYPPPPPSIFFDVLSRQVYAQYAAGEGAATDDNPYRSNL
jgi:hypothetical protein